MKRVIAQSTRALAALAVLLLVSCGFESNFKKIEGNGVVVTNTRPIPQDFNAVSAESGLEVIIEQGSQRTVTIEADENLHQHIKTEVDEGVLGISVDGNIRNAKASRVIVQLPQIAGLEASGGVVLKSKGIIKSETLELEAGSGANLNVTVEATRIKCDAGSGSYVALHGNAQSLEAESSSGSHINAKTLIVKTAVAEASSGGHTSVNATESVTAEASSGGQVVYKGAPASLNKKTSSGGVITQE